MDARSLMPTSAVGPLRSPSVERGRGQHSSHKEELRSVAAPAAAGVGVDNSDSDTLRKGHILLAFSVAIGGGVACLPYGSHAVPCWCMCSAWCSCRYDSRLDCISYPIASTSATNRPGAARSCIVAILLRATLATPANSIEFEAEPSAAEVYHGWSLPASVRCLL